MSLLQMDERIEKLNKLRANYPELDRALEISRHVLSITNVWSEEPRIIIEFEILEEMLKTKGDQK